MTDVIVVEGSIEPLELPRPSESERGEGTNCTLTREIASTFFYIAAFLRVCIQLCVRV